MTIRQYLKEQLFEYGLWPVEAENIIKQLELSEKQKPMLHRWDEETSNYPLPMLAVLLTQAKREALVWIDKNAPKHFAKVLLTT